MSPLVIICIILGWYWFREAKRQDAIAARLARTELDLARLRETVSARHLAQGLHDATVSGYNIPTPTKTDE